MSTEATETKTLAAYIAVKKDPVKLIRDEYKKSKDAMSKHRDQWREIYRLYHGYIQDKFKKLRRCNFHFHKIFPQIELEAARFVTSGSFSFL